MASPFSYSHVGGERTEIYNHSVKFPPQSILDVMPLNSMPYVGPPLEHSNAAPLPTEVNTEPGKSAVPAMLFLPSCPAEEEWDKIVAFTNYGVGLTGSAAMGKVGPIIGLMDIAESEDLYLFRVSLPGVARDENKFQFDIQPDGKILIKGITTTGEKIVCKHSQVFEMKTQNLCPPGHFSISFQLPGPVDHQQFSASLGTDGVLQGTAKKR